jgi:pyruvate dehydrogenase E1 component alpha subunit
MAKVVEKARRTDLLQSLRMMMLIRRFEERTAEAYARRRIGGFLHLYIGQEAVAVGAVGAMREDDYIISHYREHGHALARGLEPGPVMAELYGRADGASGGRGGSMHIFDVSKRFMGGWAIVAGHLTTACGLGLAQLKEGKQGVVLCIFGDGAVNEGEFHEALNLASVWKLPVLFIVENNLYGMGTDIRRVSAVTEIYKRAEAYAMPAEQVDGMDVNAMFEATARIAQRVRSGDGPAFLEAICYRFRGHSMSDPEFYRHKDEIEHWRRLDPIARLKNQMLTDGALSDEEFARMQQTAEDIANEAARFAEESPEPSLDTLHDHVYKENA